MIRAVAAEIVAVVVMALAWVSSLQLLWRLIGAERAFEPGVWTVTITWMVIAAGVALMTGITGGYVARRLAGTARNVTRDLAVAALSLGLLLALSGIANWYEQPAGVRGARAAMPQTALKARTHPIATLTYPLACATGILLGGRRGVRSPGAGGNAGNDARPARGIGCPALVLFVVMPVMLCVLSFVFAYYFNGVWPF